ncbi:hypothetical protein RCC89_13375 [Cytophagaceae bacterium ABcell3]|nr:hypothetical protein RCC89_13375 [Cytophagaceae bacterium ABcell3]
MQQSDQSGSVAIDMALEDVNDIISNKIGNGHVHQSNQRVSNYNLPCGVVSLDSTEHSIDYQIYTIKYGDQTPCGYSRKSGTVLFNLVHGARYNEVGARFTIEFKKYKVEVLATGDIVEVNGVLHVTNYTGGYIWEAVTSSKTIEHKIRGTLQVLYLNGKERTRNLFQSRTWASSNGWSGLNFMLAGDTIISGKKIVETGRTYEGNHQYQTEALTPLQWFNCGSGFAGPYRLQKGEFRMHLELPAVDPSCFNVEAGYKWDIENVGVDPVKVNDCNANAYKISIKLGELSMTEYQLY